MDIHIMHDREKNQDWVTINGDYEQFAVWADEEDYVEATIKLMQKFAVRCFEFPFYLHFEGYHNEIEEILSKRNTFEISYQPSGGTVLTMSGGKTFHAEIPAFTVTIPNKQALEDAFSEWFHLAQENNMWLMTQQANVYYHNKYAAIDLTRTPFYYAQIMMPKVFPS